MSRDMRTSALFIFFVIIYHAVGQNNFTNGSGGDQDLLMSLENSTAAPSTNRSVVNASSKIYEFTWNMMLSHSLDVIHFMMCQTKRPTDYIRKIVTLKKHEKRKSYILIYTNELADDTPQFEKVLACKGTPMKVISWKLDVYSDTDKLVDILETCLNMEEDVRSVVVASSHVEFIQIIFNIVTSDVQFKWRLLFHATEWIVLTTDQMSDDSPLLNLENLPDFMTVASPEELQVKIHQKSRTQKLKTVLEISVNPDSSESIRSEEIEANSSRLLNFTSETLKPTKTRQLLNKTFLSQHLRRDAMTFLITQKSEMADMHIPAVVVTSEQERMAFLEKKGNRTYWTGFNIDVLNILSDFLGFSAEPFPVSDGGFYSVFKPNGEILGITGYLVRREAGLSPMDMVSSTRRSNVIDFVYSGIRNEPLYIMYKIKFGRNQLGDPNSELIDTTQDLIFVLIGPCIVIVIGLVVFLVSGVFLTSEKIFGRGNLRRLYDFPLQWMFQTTEDCPHHSGRILRASWGLFCVVMFASYGALLTTNATAPPEYPKIDSVEDLLTHPNFKIGISPSNSHFMTAMEQAKEGTPLADLWRVMSEQNKSDPSTFSVDRVYHIKKVLGGGYAFLDNTPIGLVSSLVNADYTDVRFSQVHKRQSRFGVPDNAFYKHDLELALMAVTEYGIVDALSHKWFPPKTSLQRSKVEYGPVVKLFRLEFLLYIVVIGIGLASLGLVAECALRLRSCFVKRRIY